MIDSHCHIAQTSSTGLETADDFESGTRSALCGGTTTIIPFAAQQVPPAIVFGIRDPQVRGEAVLEIAVPGIPDACGYHQVVALLAGSLQRRRDADGVVGDGR